MPHILVGVSVSSHLQGRRRNTASLPNPHVLYMYSTYTIYKCKHKLHMHVEYAVAMHNVQSVIFLGILFESEGGTVFKRR